MTCIFPENKGENGVESNFGEKKKGVAILVSLGAVGGAVLGAFCCLPLISKKKIKAILSKIKKVVLPGGDDAVDNAIEYTLENKTRKEDETDTETESNSSTPSQSRSSDITTETISESESASESESGDYSGSDVEKV